MNASENINNTFDKKHLVFRFVPTMRCNFRCSYCFLKHSDGTEPTMFDSISVDQWIDGIKRFSDHDLDIYMWGGEPFCIDPTYELVRKLNELDFVKWMRIDTNLSYSKKILKCCPSSKVRLNCSWHTEVFDYETVKQRILELKKENMVGMLNFVASDTNLAYLNKHNLNLDSLVAEFADHGVFMNVAADFHKGNDPGYREFITRYTTVLDWENIHGTYPSKGVQCDAGSHFFTIENDGSLTSCGRMKETLFNKSEPEIVGHLFTGELLRRESRCPRTNCLSLVSYCHRQDNPFFCKQHLDDYVLRNIEHRINTGLLKDSHNIVNEHSGSQRVQVRNLNQKDNQTVELFKKAADQFAYGNMVSAQRTSKEYQEAMDYDQLQIHHKETRKKDPLFSVVIVTYNRPADVQDCIQSLDKQHYRDFEVVVIDNGDADKKASHLTGKVDVYVDCPTNFNLSEGRNIGAHCAAGDILVFLDDDALVGPEYLSTIRNAFQEYDILALRGRAFPKNHEKPDQQVSIYDFGDQPSPSLCNQEGNSAFRRDAYLAVGGMDPLLFGHEGSDISYRLMQQFNNMSAVMYWPQTIIYHDYGTADQFNEKQIRYKRNRDYIKYKYGLDVIELKDKIRQNPLKQNTSGQLLSPLPEIQNVPQTPPAPVVSHENQPKVSIVMSCHNAAQFLAETMESIFIQTFTDWELLVTDDGSSDQTKSLLMDYVNMDSRIRVWFYDEQKGPYVRRNDMITKAKTSFIVIQDADDLMASDKLKILYEEIISDEKLGIVGSYYRRFLDTFREPDFGDRMEKRITHEEMLEAFPQTWHLCWHGSAIIRKSLFDIIGLYDEQPYGSDTFWLSKAGMYGFMTGRIRFKNLPEYLTYKREHAESQTGKISPADPRSRRHRLERYYLQKLRKIASQAKEDPSIDLAQKIKACTCTDFIPQFEQLFEKWESVPVTDAMINGLINRGLTQFSSEQYTSALITLNCLDRMVPAATQSIKDLNLTRGLAWYACGDDIKAKACLEKESQLTGNPYALSFLSTFVKTPSPTPGAALRRANVKRFIETASQNNASPTETVAEQHSSFDLSNELHEKLSMAKHFLSQGRSQQAAKVYRDILSDNMLVKHIALKEKLKQLVGLIETNTHGQTSCN